MTELKFSKKHKIKEDRFIEKVFEAQQWVLDHNREMVTTGVAVIVIALVSFFIYNSRQSRFEKAHNDFGKAMMVLQSGDTLTATDQLREIINRYGSSPEAAMSSFLLGGISYARADYSQAEEYYKRNLKKYGAFPFICGASLRSLGNCAIQQKQYAQAIGYFNDFIKQYPSHYLLPEVLLSLGECQLRENNIPAAKETLQKAADGFSQTPYGITARNLLATL